MVRQEDWTHAQASVIGSALIDPKCVPIIIGGIAADDLTGEYRTMYDAIRELAILGRPVDPVTVLNRIGPAYEPTVRRLMEETPTAANVAAYIDVCKEQSRLSRLASLGTELIGAASIAAAREILQQMQAVSVEREAARIVDMQTALAGFFERHQAGKRDFISVGMGPLDERLYIDLGDVVVLGGYPSDGKTALMLQWCWHIAKTLPVGIFSFETHEEKLTDRAVTQAVPQLRLGDVKRNEMTPAQWKAVTGQSVEITKRRLEIVEASGMSVEDVLGVTLSRGYKVIALDYVQLVSPGTVRRGGTRAEEVAEISKALALMARRHKLLVIELSQLTRPPKDKSGKTPAPTLSSLRESGQLEQDADVVALLYRIGAAAGANRELFIAKNKEGETGRMELRFDGQAQRFSYVARDDDIPKALLAAQRNRYEAKKEAAEQTTLPM